MREAPLDQPSSHRAVTTESAANGEECPVRSSQHGDLPRSFGIIRALMIRRNDDARDNVKYSRSERILRAVQSGASSAIARVFQLGISLITIRLTIHYLGAERFGLWMTIFSLINILNFADFGIGNGLLNAIAEAYGRRDSKSIQEAISSGFFALSILSLFFCALFLVSYQYIHWSSIFKLHSPTAVREAGPTTFIFFACFAVALPLGVAQRIQLALQKGYLNGIWSILGTTVGFVGLCLALRAKLGLPWLVLSVAGGPSISLLANCIFIFCRQPNLRPSLACVSRKFSKQILKAGTLFFVLQIAMAVGYQSDNIVIARILGPEAVASYSVALRIFQSVPIFLGFFMLALWPAYGEAVAGGDYAWIRATYRRSVSLNGLIGVIAALVLFVSARLIIRLWVGRGLEPTHLLLIALAAYCITNSLVGPISAMMDGMSLLRFQAVSWSIMAVANLTLSIWLTKLIGVSGVVFGSVISQGVFILIPSIWYIRSVLTGSQSGEVGNVAGSELL